MPQCRDAQSDVLVGVSSQVATTVGSFDPAAQSTGEPLGHGTLLTVLGGIVATVSVQNGTIGPVNVGTPLSQTTGPYDTYTSKQGATGTNGANLVHQTKFTAVGPDNTATVGSSALLASTINSLLTSLTAHNNLQVCILVVICVGPVVDPILAALNGLLMFCHGSSRSAAGDADEIARAAARHLAPPNMAGATLASWL